MDWLPGSSGMEVSGGWTYGVADLLAWGMLVALLFAVPLVVLFSRARRRRRFWCAESARDVDVEFEARGLPGFREEVVKRCSNFDPETAVVCRRSCLDPAQQYQWPPALGLGRAR